MNNIPVSRPSMPPIEEYFEEIKDIFCIYPSRHSAYSFNNDCDIILTIIYPSRQTFRLQFRLEDVFSPIADLPQ